MAAGHGLDEAMAGRLALRDPALALLPEALARARQTRSRVHDVQWRPGEGVRLALGRPRDGGPEQFHGISVDADGLADFDYREDAALPGLAAASDPDLVSHLLTGRLDEEVTACRVGPVRYRPGSRCVLRYDVVTPDRRITLFAKVLRPEDWPAMSDRLVRLAAVLAPAGVVPPVVAAWPTLQGIVTDAVDGRAASRIVRDPTVPRVSRVQLVREAGGLLARFHALADVAAPDWSTRDQLSYLADSMRALERVDAHLGGRLAALLEALAATAPAEQPTVVGHGGFRLGQLMSGAGGELTVLDTDGTCRTDPARDVASTLAHLRWQAVRRPADRAVLRAAEQALVQGYRAGSGSVSAENLRWWRAAGLLQVAVRRYTRLEVSSWPDVPALVDAADDLLVEHRVHTSPTGTVDLLDPDAMSGVLQSALASSAADPARLRLRSAEQLPTATRDRAVVRYTVSGMDRGSPSPVIGKVLADRRHAELLYEHLRVLSLGPFREGELRVPEPLGLVRPLRMVLYRGCAGRPLDGLLGRPDAEERVRRAAQWLARLHTAGTALPRTFSLAAESANSRRWASLVGRAYPDLAGPSRMLAERWAEGAEAAGCRHDVPLHKDFHAGHVLVDASICVIDLDEARLGDPAFDIAHFCTYLRVVDDGGRNAFADRLGTAFVDEYAGATGWVDKGAYAPFCAYTWLKIAKQWARGSGPGRDATPEQRRAGATRALVEGSRCLSG